MMNWQPFLVTSLLRLPDMSKMVVVYAKGYASATERKPLSTFVCVALCGLTHHLYLSTNL